MNSDANPQLINEKSQSRMNLLSHLLRPAIRARRVQPEPSSENFLLTGSENLLRDGLYRKLGRSFA
jgi:hypothetical protein